jgi:hypothetical protein
MTRAHQRCIDAGEHICQQPSGRKCIVAGCDREAGTLWGPLWCPDHDRERIDRISGQMAKISTSFRNAR